MPHDFITFEHAQKFRYVKVTSIQLPYDEPFAISGFRIFGTGNGDSPQKVEKITTQRSDELSALISWEASTDAMGYNVRYGIAPGKLYSSYLIYEKNQVLLTTLNSGQEYWCTVEAFNENGISKASDVIKIK